MAKLRHYPTGFAKSAAAAARCTEAHGVDACAAPAGSTGCWPPWPVEDGDPLARSMIAEADLEALALYPSEDAADSAPVVEAAVQRLKLRRAWLEGEAPVRTPYRRSPRGL